MLYCSFFSQKKHLIHTSILEKGSYCPKNQGEQQMQTNDKIQTLQLDSCHDIFGEDPGVGSGMIINGLYMPCTHTEKPTYVVRQCIYTQTHHM